MGIFSQFRLVAVYAAFLLIPCAYLTFILASNIFALVKGRKAEFAYGMVTFVMTLLAGAAYFLNFGWFRMFLILLFIEQCVIVYVLARISAQRTKESKWLTASVIGMYITSFTCWFFLPDGGDDGGARLFFSLFTSDDFNVESIYIYLTAIISFLLFHGLTYVIITLKIVYALKPKKQGN